MGQEGRNTCLGWSGVLWNLGAPARLEQGRRCWETLGGPRGSSWGQFSEHREATHPPTPEPVAEHLGNTSPPAREPGQEQGKQALSVNHHRRDGPQRAHEPISY